MESQTVGLEALQELYDKWFDMRLKDIDQLEKIKSEIDEIVRHIKGYIFTQPDYWIISLGHDLIFGRLNEANVSLDQLENINSELNDKQKYYYFLFKGSYLSVRSNLSEAQVFYQKAKEQLLFYPNQIEEAEFNYKIGSLYYHLKKTLDSIYHISTALSLFKTKEGYDRRIAGCEIGLGLNSIDLHQWEEAEERFYSALNFANKVDDLSLKGLIYHDLGLLYAEQNMSKAAIHWLKESAKSRLPIPKTVYLLCKENFNLGNYDEANKWLTEGVELSSQQQDIHYEKMFQVLDTVYNEKDEIIYENTLIESLHFFQEEESWTNVEEVSHYLAEFYSLKKKYKRAVDYFHLLIDAQNKIVEQEALK
jgi:response regulator aspartate phosphatase C